METTCGDNEEMKPYLISYVIHPLYQDDKYSDTPS